MTNKEIEKQIRKLIKLCKAIGIYGKTTAIDGYYVSFKFEPEKKKCKECGKIKD